MRPRMRIQKCFVMTEKMADSIQAIADAMNVSFADVVRECVEKELPRLRERQRKRKKARK